MKGPKQRLDSARARRAKVALAERLEKIALGCVPAGWTVVYHKRLSGRCSHSTKTIKAPRPITRKSIQIFLHECAHAHQHTDGKRRPRHVEELEAEEWSLAKMREHGIPIPRIVMRRARENVGWTIQKAERGGAKRIDPRARKFAGHKVAVTLDELRRALPRHTVSELEVIAEAVRRGDERFDMCLRLVKALRKLEGRT
jgi:hypothetical protein